MTNQVGIQDYDKRLTPTDIAQFVRLGECHRYLKMRQYERKKGDGFLRNYGVAPQSIPPLLTLSGQRFEEHIEQASRQHFQTIHCRKDLGQEVDAVMEEAERVSQLRVDNQFVIDQARALLPGTTLLIFQPRLETVLKEWLITGDCDILRLDRDLEGNLSIFIIDIKSTTKAKLEHRLQVAFYHNMLVRIFKDANLAFVQMNLGIVYRGPANAEVYTSAVSGEEIVQRIAAKTLLGVDNALLEVITDKDAYLYEIQEMVMREDSVVNRIARTPFADNPFHLNYRCDGCLYQEWCMKAAFEDDDLSLIPTLTASEKRILGTVCVTTKEVAQLMKIVTNSKGRPRLVPSKGKHDEVQSLRVTAIGPRLQEIIHRAKQMERSRQREIRKAETRRMKATFSNETNETFEEGSLL